jgi:DNA invertase Pin-like site-specific DNA recombinase
LPHPSTHGLSPKDQATIATLAQETDTDQAVVKDLYDEELATLHTQASVKNFIRVIAARRVRQRIAAARERGQPIKERAA